MVPVAGLLVACDGGGSASPALRQPATVRVDGRSDAVNIAAAAYFPKEVRVHAGGSVRFLSVFRGEPHTVTMGTLVAAGIARATAADPRAPTEPPDLRLLPNFLSPIATDVVASAAEPCFLDGGSPPLSGACPRIARRQPIFTGKQTYYNSGFLPDAAAFIVRLSSDIAPGRYPYMCLFHRAAMTGTIVVVPADVRAQTPPQAAAAGAAQLDDLVEKLRPAVEPLAHGAAPDLGLPAVPGVGAVLAGSTVRALAATTRLVQFGPRDVTIPTGGTVTWTVVGDHTISFGAPAAARGILVRTGGGGVHTNVLAVAPTIGFAGAGSGAGPGEGGSWDGVGFRSSGLIRSPVDAPLAYSLTFTTPGSYAYACLVHPDMGGTITVE